MPSVVSQPGDSLAGNRSPGRRLLYSQTGAVRVSRWVAQAHLVKKVEPAGDWLGDARNVQGEVEFEAVIGKRGGVVKLQLVHGHPLLVGRAEEAVLQYRYRPFVFKKGRVAVS
jgi:hypothetical protein